MAHFQSEPDRNTALRSDFFPETARDHRFIAQTIERRVSGLRRQTSVGIEQHHDITSGLGGAKSHPLARVAEDAAAKLFGHGSRPVAAIAIDHNHFPHFGQGLRPADRSLSRFLVCCPNSELAGLGSVMKDMNRTGPLILSTNRVQRALHPQPRFFHHVGVNLRRAHILSLGPDAVFA